MHSGDTMRRLPGLQHHAGHETIMSVFLEVSKCHWKTGFYTLIIRTLQMTFMLLIGHTFPHHNPVMQDSPLAGLVAWDSLWFVAIAKYGYSVPQTLAFFPGLPFLIHHVDSKLILCAWPLMSGLTAMLQQDIFKRIFKGKMNCDNDLAASLYFSFNPAIAHLCALYTETPCIFLSTICMWLVLHIEEESKKTYIFADILITLLLTILTSLFRSNGILMYGFVSCLILRNNITDNSMMKRWFFVILLGMCVLLPLHTHLYTHAKALSMDVHLWELFPGYAQVQRQFWDVCFLCYYKIRNIPRFILMFPTLISWIMGCLKAIQACKNSVTFRTVLFRPYALPWGIIVAIHALVQAMLCLLTANVEILPRLLWGSSPLLLSALIPKKLYLLLAAQGILGMWLFALHYAYT